MLNNKIFSNQVFYEVVDEEEDVEIVGTIFILKVITFFYDGLTVKSELVEIGN